MEMTLSRAIREGAKLHHQAVEDYIVRRPDGEYTTCAMGAAAEVIYGFDATVAFLENNTRPLSHEIARSCGVERLRVDNPVDYRSDYVVNVVVALNDLHMWSREAIADWLEGMGY